MADGRHFEIVKALYFSEKLSDFDEVWCAEVNSDKVGTHAEIQNFRNSRGGCLPFLK